jgi:hypothetical protein
MNRLEDLRMIEHIGTIYRKIGRLVEKSIDDVFASELLWMVIDD